MKINPFDPNAPFLSILKEKGYIGNEWVKQVKLKLKEVFLQMKICLSSGIILELSNIVAFVFIISVC